MRLTVSMRSAGAGSGSTIQPVRMAAWTSGGCSLIHTPSPVGVGEGWDEMDAEAELLELEWPGEGFGWVGHIGAGRTGLVGHAGSSNRPGAGAG